MYMSRVIFYILSISFVFADQRRKEKLSEAIHSLADAFLNEKYSSFVGDVLSEHLVGECIFQCDNKKRKPIARKTYKSTSNGCGSYEFTFNFDFVDMPGFNKCCVEHDHCYGTCLSSKRDCDDTFVLCLFYACVHASKEFDWHYSKVEKCESTADLMYHGVQKLGCPAFSKSQREACDCGDD